MKLSTTLRHRKAGLLNIDRLTTRRVVHILIFPDPHSYLAAERQPILHPASGHSLARIVIGYLGNAPSCPAAELQYLPYLTHHSSLSPRASIAEQQCIRLPAEFLNSRLTRLSVGYVPRSVSRAATVTHEAHQLSIVVARAGIGQIC